jgi:hypothetical protein
MKRSSSDKCLPMWWYAQALRDAEEILTCVRKYVEPCSRCHATDA